MRKKPVGTFSYLSLQILHTPDHAGSARLYFQYCRVMYLDPNVGEMLFLVPHICNPLDLSPWYCCLKVLVFHSTWRLVQKSASTGMMLRKCRSSLILKGVNQGLVHCKQQSFCSWCEITIQFHNVMSPSLEIFGLAASDAFQGTT